MAAANLKHLDCARLDAIGLTSHDLLRPGLRLSTHTHDSANDHAHRLSTIRTFTPPRASAVAHITPAGPAPIYSWVSSRSVLEPIYAQ